MNRRKFLSALAAVPIAGVLSAELAEALAPSRSIFLPPRTGWPERLLTAAPLIDVGDVFSVTYDGRTITYRCNGIELPPGRNIITHGVAVCGGGMISFETRALEVA